MDETKERIKELIDEYKKSEDKGNQILADLLMEYTILNDRLRSSRELLANLQMEYRQLKSDIWKELGDYKTITAKEKDYSVKKLENEHYVALSIEIAKLESEIGFYENELKVINSFLISQGGR